VTALEQQLVVILKEKDDALVTNEELNSKLEALVA
jgi:hypothetical protein